MKAKRLLLLGGAVVATAIIISLAVSAYWEHKQPRFENAPKVIAALQRFSHDQIAAGQPLPPEVSLKGLVAGGYVAPSDVRAFDGMELTFATRIDDHYPQSVLARARPGHGPFICLLADGSVQSISRSRYEQQRTNGQLDGALNGTGTNSTSVAADSGH